MIPKANIWQELRQRCLENIPVGTRLSFPKPLTFNEWQKQGYYTLLNQTNKKYQLLSDKSSLSSAFLGDIQILLDCSTEHHVSIWNKFNTGTWISPTWMIVTYYYWSYYLALAMSRMLGNMSIYIDHDLARLFNGVALKSTGNPGSGSFKVELQPTQSPQDVLIIYSKNNTRIHESTWTLWHEACRALVNKHRGHIASDEEFRIFNCITSIANIIGDDWPIKFRNVANYRAGYAYDSINGKGLFNIFHTKAIKNSSSVLQILDLFENSLVRIKLRSDIYTNPELLCELLIYNTYILSALVNELHSELVTINNIDRRWNNNRNAFINSYGLNRTPYSWPCS